MSARAARLLEDTLESTRRALAVVQKAHTNMAATLARIRGGDDAQLIKMLEDNCALINVDIVGIKATEQKLLDAIAGEGR